MALGIAPTIAFSTALSQHPTRHLYLDPRNNPDDILVGE